jgi:hypothetical protein
MVLSFKQQSVTLDIHFNKLKNLTAWTVIKNLSELGLLLYIQGSCQAGEGCRLIAFKVLIC